MNVFRLLGITSGIAAAAAAFACSQILGFGDYGPGTGGGGGAGGAPDYINAVCTAICDCQTCTDAEWQDCYDEGADLEAEAKQLGCVEEFVNLVKCIADEGTCVNGYFDARACDPQAAAYTTCKTAGCSKPNGTCDPYCPPGVDPDCPHCVADGFCDPSCAPGVDPDCGDACVADGYCDPACAPGLDPDC